MLPAVIVFGLGLVATVAPVTATALAAADPRHAGAASGVNNAVARAAGLVAAAILPPIAGLTDGAFQNPTAMAAGFHVAMLVTAGLAVAGAVLASRPSPMTCWAPNPPRHLATTHTAQWPGRRHGPLIPSRLRQ